MNGNCFKVIAHYFPGGAEEKHENQRIIDTRAENLTSDNLSNKTQD
jgi:hypothetical protein